MSTNLLLNVWALPNKLKIVDFVVQILVLRFFTAVENADLIRLIKIRKEMSPFNNATNNVFPLSNSIVSMDKNIKQIIRND